MSQVVTHFDTKTHCEVIKSPAKMQRETAREPERLVVLYMFIYILRTNVLHSVCQRESERERERERERESCL